MGGEGIAEYHEFLRFKSRLITIVWAKVVEPPHSLKSSKLQWQSRSCWSKNQRCQKASCSPPTRLMPPPSSSSSSSNLTLSLSLFLGLPRTHFVPVLALAPAFPTSPKHFYVSDVTNCVDIKGCHTPSSFSSSSLEPARVWSRRRPCLQHVCYCVAAAGGKQPKLF